MSYILAAVIILAIVGYGAYVSLKKPNARGGVKFQDTTGVKFKDTTGVKWNRD